MEQFASIDINVHRTRSRRSVDNTNKCFAPGRSCSMWCCHKGDEQSERSHSKQHPSYKSSYRLFHVHCFNVSSFRNINVSCACKTSLLPHILATTPLAVSIALYF